MLKPPIEWTHPDDLRSEEIVFKHGDVIALHPGLIGRVLKVIATDEYGYAPMNSAADGDAAYAEFDRAVQERTGKSINELVGRRPDLPPMLVGTAAGLAEDILVVYDAMFADVSPDKMVMTKSAYEACADLEEQRRQVGYKIDAAKYKLHDCLLAEEYDASRVWSRDDVVEALVRGGGVILHGQEMYEEGGVEFTLDEWRSLNRAVDDRVSPEEDE